MNHVNLIGKMSSKPRIVELSNGRKIAQFTISTKEVYLDKSGEQKTRSNWHRLTAWGKFVGILENICFEGMEVAVEGKLKSRYFRSNGHPTFVQEVEVNDLVIL